MQREYVQSDQVARLMRFNVRFIALLGGVVLCMGPLGLLGDDTMGWLGVAAFILLTALGFYIAMKRMVAPIVLVAPEGLRFGHVPESPLVPWEEIHGVRERPLGGCLELLDIHGEKCFQLDYYLEGFAELRDHVLTHVPIALPTPIRFRRSWGIDVVWLLLSLFPPLVFLAIYEQRKSPYAVQVTDSELVLSMLFRTVRIPLQELELASKTENHKGMLIPLLEVEEPKTGKSIIIRNVGVDMIVLKATLEEAVRTRPFARA